MEHFVNWGGGIQGGGIRLFLRSWDRIVVCVGTWDFDNFGIEDGGGVRRDIGNDGGMVQARSVDSDSVDNSGIDSDRVGNSSGNDRSISWGQIGDSRRINGSKRGINSSWGWISRFGRRRWMKEQA